MLVKKIRELFDLGVEIVLGDDEICVTGRDFIKGRADEDRYTERMWTFPSDADLNFIYGKIAIDLKGESPEVANCPFCGKEASVEYSCGAGIVSCTDPECTLGFVVSNDPFCKESVGKWNNRV